MMALGHQLRADDDVEAALRDVVELRAQALHRFHQIARQHQDAAAREQLGRLLLQPLDAGADRREAFGGVAVRTFRRRRHREAAMVADQLLSPLEAVIDQPGIAIRALQAEAAGAAQRERRVAAAVEEQQRLLAALERDLHRFGEPWRNEPPARRAFAPHVDRLDRSACAGRRSAPADECACSGRAAR